MDFNQKQVRVICEISRGTFSTLFYVDVKGHKYALKVLTNQESR